MGPGTVLVIIVGIPLILVSIGFVFLMLKLFRSGGGSADQARILELATDLERTLANIEKRLGSLEDIILAPPSSGREKNND